MKPHHTRSSPAQVVEERRPSALGSPAESVDLSLLLLQVQPDRAPAEDRHLVEPPLDRHVRSLGGRRPAFDVTVISPDPSSTS